MIPFITNFNRSAQAFIRIGTFTQEEGNVVTIPLESFVTSRTAIIGQSGSGKSYLIGVICEELCKLNFSFIIIDPEGEYYTLKEKYDILWAGPQDKADIPLTVDICAELVQEVLSNNIPLILDTSELKPTAVVTTESKLLESWLEFELISRFCRKLYAIETKLRKPCLLIVEECDRFAPQSKRTTGIRMLHEITRRGRKRGIGLVIATQRPALVDKNILSQCNNQFLGKLTILNDLNAVRLFFRTRETALQLTKLKKGEFFMMGDIINSIATGPTEEVEEPLLISVRRRETSHKGGATPTLLTTPIARPLPQAPAGGRRRTTTSVAIEKVVLRLKNQIEERRKELEVKLQQQQGEQRQQQLRPQPQRTTTEPPIMTTTGRMSSKQQLEQLQAETLLSLPPLLPPLEKFGVDKANLIPFKLSLAEAQKLAVKHKRRFFGQEHIVEVSSCYHPLVVCKVTQFKPKLFGKRIVDITTCWDGVSGEWLRIDSKGNLKRSKGFGLLHQLDCDDIKVFKALVEAGNEQLTAVELATKTALEKRVVDSALRNLIAKKLVVEGEKVGYRIYKYAPLTDIKFPTNIKQLDTVILPSRTYYSMQTSSLTHHVSTKTSSPQPAPVTTTTAKLAELKYSTTTIREILKGIFGRTVEIKDSSVIYFPYYEVTYIDKNNQQVRKIRINGYNGEVEQI